MRSEGGLFNIELSDSRHLNSGFICIACGGYPKSSMFNWLKELGHLIEEPAPSLFTFNLPKHPISQLMGVSVGEVRVKITGTKLVQQGPVLITHWGLSGPAILRLSAWAAKELKEKNWEFGISINWLPHFNEQQLREEFKRLRSEMASQKVISKNRLGLPARLWEFLALQSGIKPGWRWADLPSAEQNRFIKNLCTYECGRVICAPLLPPMLSKTQAHGRRVAAKISLSSADATPLSTFYGERYGVTGAPCCSSAPSLGAGAASQRR